MRAPIRTPLAEEDVGDTTSQHAGWRRSEVGAWRGQERMRTRARCNTCRAQGHREEVPHPAAEAAALPV